MTVPRQRTHMPRPASEILVNGGTGQPIIVMVPPDREREEASVIARIGRGELVARYQTDRCHKDGQGIEVSVAISAVRDANGIIVETSSIVRGLTDRNALDQRIHDLEAELACIRRLIEADHVIPALFHEATEALTAIINYANAGHRLATSVGQVRNSIVFKHVTEQAYRMSKFVQRVRRYAKKNGAKMLPENMTFLIAA